MLNTQTSELDFKSLKSPIGFVLKLVMEIASWLRKAKLRCTLDGNRRLAVHCSGYFVSTFMPRQVTDHEWIASS